jgi:hypothetical protein
MPEQIISGTRPSPRDPAASAAGMSEHRAADQLPGARAARHLRSANTTPLGVRDPQAVDAETIQLAVLLRAADTYLDRLRSWIENETSAGRVALDGLRASELDQWSVLLDAARARIGDAATALEQSNAVSSVMYVSAAADDRRRADDRPGELRGRNATGIGGDLDQFSRTTHFHRG